MAREVIITCDFCNKPMPCQRNKFLKSSLSIGKPIAVITYPDYKVDIPMDVCIPCIKKLVKNIEENHQ